VIVRNLHKWIKTDRKGKRYSGYGEILSKLLKRAVKENIPAVLLMDKIREGAAKRIPPQRLITAVKNELTRLKTAKAIVYRQNIKPENEDQYANRLKHISILLLGGIKDKTITGLFNLMAETKRTADDILAACDVLVEFNSINLLAQDDLYGVGKALLFSRLKASTFSGISSIYLNARAKRIKTEDILTIIKNTLTNGGGIIQLDQEISNRGRHR